MKQTVREKLESQIEVYTDLVIELENDFKQSLEWGAYRKAASHNEKMKTLETVIDELKQLL
tara:strand:+ start:884 stop:1066 length:183 start_codon:yes stop_codon:yes gene_type:complete